MGEWHVLAVSEVDSVPRAQPAELEEAERRLAEVQPSALRARTWKLVAIAAAFLVVVAVVAVPPLVRRGNAGIGDRAELGRRPRSFLRRAQLHHRDVGTPGRDHVRLRIVWVTNPDAETVTRIDEGTKAVIDIHVGSAPAGIAGGEGVIWVVESGGPTVSRISPDTNQVVGDPIGVGNGPADIAVGEGAVWVTNRFDGTVSRIDPDRGEVVKEFSVGLDPSGIAVGFDSVWVVLAGSNTVVRVDPKTNEVLPPIDVGNGPGSLLVSSDAVWVVNSIADTVSRIDPETNLETEAIPVGDGPAGIAFAEGAVWVANGSDGTLSRIDPGSRVVEPAVGIGSIPQGLATAAGSLWVTVRGIATDHRGGTLQLVSTRKEAPGTLDPVEFYFAPQPLMSIMGDGLVGFKRVGGIDGGTLVPDLALTLPTPSNEGKTYVFQLRPGIRYSNGETVVASDFHHGIERGFRIQNLITPAFDYFGSLVGGRECKETPESCDLSEGIVSDDQAGTVTFHLEKPNPDFLSNLALSNAFPVPSSTPIDEQQTRAGVPGTGPYMLEDPMTKHGLVLVRNEYFDQWSADAQPDGNVDRIEWTFGGTPDELVDAVANGEADYMLGDPPRSRIEDLASSSPLRSTSIHSRCLTTSPSIRRWHRSTTRTFGSR